MSLNLEDPSLQKYGTDVLSVMKENYGLFEPLAKNWEGIMDSIEVQTLAKSVDRIISEQGKKLVAILGPGAVGKGTVQEGLGWQRIINTTTRKKRPKEKHGKDYFFIRHEIFDQKRTHGEFAVTTFREGRGWYGIEWSELENKINHPDISGHLVVEENADTLIRLHASLSQRGYPNKIHGIYLMPPSPRFAHILARYIRRCHVQGQDPLNPIALESTLGSRQISEFTVAKNISSVTPGTEGINIDFVENTNITQTISHVKQLIEKDI